MRFSSEPLVSGLMYRGSIVPLISPMDFTPSLVRLHADGADSREFIKRANEEAEEPVLFVPAKTFGSDS